MSKKETKNTVQPHTEAKLKFYIDYLEIYLAILCRNTFIKKINIYDMFCGQAIYADGKASGAVRAFNKIKEVQESSPNSDTVVTLTLNDSDKKRIKNIREWLDKQNKTFKIHLHNEDATDLIKNLISGINKQNTGVRNLVFIDPYGYKHIDKKLIESLLKNERTEVILFLPVNQMNRFKGVENPVPPLKNFINQFNIDPNANIKDIALIKKIEQGFSFGDRYFSTSYYIKNKQGSHYALFFITAHIYGLEKIVEVKWKLDDQQGSGFNDSTQQDLFLENEKISELENNLKDYLETSRNNNEIYEWTLKQGFSPKHTAKILTDFAKNKEIEVEYFLKAKSGYHINHGNYKNEIIKVTVKNVN